MISIIASDRVHKPSLRAGVVFAGALFSLLAPVGAYAGPISIDHAWSRATPGGAEVAVGYLTIKNDGDAPDRLVSASVEIAGRAELHSMSMQGGMMKMRELKEGLPVLAKNWTVLEPSGNHLMFLDLKHPLKEGDRFAGTLTFEKAGTVPVTFDVKSVGATSPGNAEENKPGSDVKTMPNMKMDMH